jgi:hypothetical protein
MPKIFISYRRADSAPVAGRIDDHLTQAFGRENVFKDSWSIQAGQDFRAAIREALVNVNVLLVIIGPDWINLTDSSGVRRLDMPNDFVRSEVEIGLQDRDTVVIPVLVHGARMPRPDELPISIRELAFRNAIQVRDDPDFRRDMDELIHVLDGSSSQTTASKTSPKRGRRIDPTVIVAIITAISAIVVAVIGIVPNLLNQPTPTPPPTVVTESPTTEAANIPTATPNNQPTATMMPTLAPTITPAVSANTNAALTLTIFRDNESFTLYIPQSSEPYSLDGFTFRMTNSQGEDTDHTLDDFLAFQGMPFSNITALNQPICFRLYRQGAAVSAPLDCTGGDVLLLNQGLADADVFWYDRSINQPRTVTVLQNGTMLDICPAGQSTCEIAP